MHAQPILYIGLSSEYTLPTLVGYSWLWFWLIILIPDEPGSLKDLHLVTFLLIDLPVYFMLPQGITFSEP